MTGGTGFLGKFLIKHLCAQNYNIINVTRKDTYFEKTSNAINVNKKFLTSLDMGWTYVHPDKGLKTENPRSLSISAIFAIFRIQYIFFQNHEFFCCFMQNSSIF